MAEEAKQEEAKAEPAPAEEKKEAEEKPPEEKPPEEKPTEEKPPEEKPAEEKTAPEPPPPFVLYVDLHCVGCAKKIQRSILKIRGVEGVVIDMHQNQVTIKGVVEPQAVCNAIMKKTKRKAKVVSPLPATEGEPLPPVVTSQVTGVTTLELNVNMHCEACADQLKKKILKMRGVQTVLTELNAGKVMVTGTMDGEKLVDYVYRRTKKQAKIVPQPEPEPAPESEPKPEPKPEKEAEKSSEEAKAEEKNEEKKDERPAEEVPEKEEKQEKEAEEEDAMVTSEEGMKRMMYYYQPLYVIERIPPPQLFSDENPNACCIS